MSIALPPDTTKRLQASIKRYISENLDQDIGDLQAGLLLDFCLKEIGPSVYNKAVADAQENLQARVLELDIEVHEDEFQYWQKRERKGKGRK